MKTIEERAREFADRHEEAELNLRGLGGVYGYNRIKNAEICAYKRGAEEQRKIDIDKAYDWLKARNVLIDASLEGFRKTMEE